MKNAKVVTEKNVPNRLSVSVLRMSATIELVQSVFNSGKTFIGDAVIKFCDNSGLYAIIDVCGYLPLESDGTITMEMINTKELKRFEDFEEVLGKTIEQMGFNLDVHEPCEKGKFAIYAM